MKMTKTITHLSGHVEHYIAVSIKDYYDLTDRPQGYTANMDAILDLDVNVFGTLYFAEIPAWNGTDIVELSPDADVFCDPVELIDCVGKELSKQLEELPGKLAELGM